MDLLFASVDATFIGQNVYLFCASEGLATVFRGSANQARLGAAGGVRQVNPSFQFDADGQSDLQVLWEDGERVLCRGWRADGDGGRSAGLAVSGLSTSVLAGWSGIEALHGGDIFLSRFSDSSQLWRNSPGRSIRTRRHSPRVNKFLCAPFRQSPQTDDLVPRGSPQTLNCDMLVKLTFCPAKRLCRQASKFGCTSLGTLREDLRPQPAALRPAQAQGMASSSATAHATPTASRKKASRWPCSSCSSTSASAGRSPTAATITSQTRSTVPTPDGRRNERHYRATC